MFSSKLSFLAGILVISLITVALYWRFFFLGEIPMPGDTLIGAYFPWLDYKWGFSVGVPVKNALISDVFSQFFLWKYLIVDIFRGGNIPLWNIYSLSGTPIMATYHSAVFNPFNLLLFLPKFYGWGFFICLQTFFAMTGMYLLLRSYTKNFWSRVLGAVVFGISGLMTTWVEFGTGVWAAGTLPWLFLFLERFFEFKRFRHLFFMSFFLIILYLSGHAQLTLYSTILILFYSCLRSIYSKKFSNFFWPAIFILLAIIFCSFQFIPTFEFTKNSIRETENYSSSFDYGLNPIYEVVKFFSADFFGNPTTGNYWDAQSYHEQSIFLGTIPFILIVAFITYSLKKRQINFWGGVFLATLLLGFENPISKAIYSLPFQFITYSSAARIFFLTSFSGGILAAFALDKIDDYHFKGILIKSNIVFLSALIGIFLGFLGSVVFLNSNIQSSQILAEINNYKVTLRNIILTLGIGTFSLTFLLIFKRKQHLKNLIMVLLVLVSVFELTRYFYKYNPFVSQDLTFPNTTAIDFLQMQTGLFRIARGDREVMPPNTWTYYKLQSIEGYDPLLSKDYARIFNLINGFDFYATPSRYRELEKYDSKFLNALNVRYFLTVKRDSAGRVKGNIINPSLIDAGFQVVFEEGNTVILENPNVLPRAYFAKRVNTFADDSDLVKTLNDKSFDPREHALIVSERQLGELTDKGSVQVTSYTANKITLKTNTQGDAFLIFSDTFDIGWKLYRNGNEEKLFKTNYAFRGLFVPSGENYFEMIYFPDSFKLGLWVAGGALIVYLVIAFYTVKSKRL